MKIIKKGLCFLLTFVLIMSTFAGTTVFAAARASTNDDVKFDWFTLESDGSAEIIVEITGGDSKFKTDAITNADYMVRVSKDTTFSSIGLIDDTCNDVTPESVTVTNDKEIKFTFAPGQLIAPATVHVTFIPSIFIEANRPNVWIGTSGLLVSNKDDGNAQRAVFDKFNKKISKIPVGEYASQDSINDYILALIAEEANKVTPGAGAKIRHQLVYYGEGRYDYNGVVVDPAFYWRAYISIGDEGFLFLDTYHIVGNPNDGGGAPNLNVVVLNNDNYNGKTVKDYIRFTSSGLTELEKGDKILIFEGNNANDYPVNGARPVASAVAKDAEIVKGVKETKMPHAVANFTFSDDKFYFYAVAKNSKDIIGKTTQIDKTDFGLNAPQFSGTVETTYVAGVGKVKDSIVVNGLNQGDMVYIFSADKEYTGDKLNEVYADINNRKKADVTVKKGSSSAVYYIKTKPSENTKFYVFVRQAQSTSVDLFSDGTIKSFTDRPVSQIHLLDVVDVAAPAIVEELDYFLWQSPFDKNSMLVLTGLNPGTYVALFDKPENSKPIKVITVRKDRSYAVFESLTLPAKGAKLWVYISTADPIVKANATTERFKLSFD